MDLRRKCVLFSARESDSCSSAERNSAGPFFFALFRFVPRRWLLLSSSSFPSVSVSWSRIAIAFPLHLRPDGGELIPLVDFILHAFLEQWQMIPLATACNTAAIKRRTLGVLDTRVITLRIVGRCAVCRSCCPVVPISIDSIADDTGPCWSVHSSTLLPSARATTAAHAVSVGATARREFRCAFASARTSCFSIVPRLHYG